MSQLGLFGAEPAPVCDNHGPGFVCEECPDGYHTGWTGFVHPLECKGRLPLRRCNDCKQLVTPGAWNHADWFRCLQCAPLGTKKAPP